MAGSGAVCLCRMQALRQAMVDNQVFDNTFFAYKEDVDLSWRLGLLGWKCLYIPEAIAYHGRGWRAGSSREAGRCLDRRRDPSQARRREAVAEREAAQAL